MCSHSHNYFKLVLLKKKKRIKIENIFSSSISSSSMDLKSRLFGVAIYTLLSLVLGELFPATDLSFKSQPYLENEQSTIAGCSMKNYKWGGSSLKSAAALIEVFASEFPHLAALGWRCGNTTSWECSGSLITPTFLLTSADCASKRPTIARMGDLDLTDPADDQFVQEFEISEVILHPNFKNDSQRYNLALLRLNDTVRTHQTVVPACLWNEQNLNYTTFESGTWNLRDEKASRPLIKIEENFDKRESQEKSKTDLPDPGGPLEIKLMGRHKLIPFLVGINSMDSAVYTKIPSHLQWIEKTVNETFNSIECALRHIDYRQYDPMFFTGKNFKYSNLKKNPSLQGFVPRTFLITKAPNNYRVRIDARPNPKCSGSIIHRQFVLTTASCVTKGAGPEFIVTSAEESIPITDVYLHPNFTETDNDIALLRLARQVRFGETVQFACPWPLDTLPARLNNYGFGPQHINFYGKEPKIVDLSIKSNLINQTDCNVDPNKFCVGNHQDLVPGSCNAELGSPIARESFNQRKYFPFIFGLSLQGEDCGFGTPVVATKVSSYIDWIDSIMFPNKITAIENVEIAEEFQGCIKENLEYRQDKVQYSNDINEQTEKSFSSSLALIGYSNDAGNITWVCDGAIVSKNFIVTTASCASREKAFATKVMAVANHNETNRQLLDVVKVVLHPKYEPGAGEYNIALLKVDSLQFDEWISPACLWFNNTHLPFLLSKPLWNFNTSVDELSSKNYNMNILLNEDCEEELNTTISSSYFCADHQFGLNCAWQYEEVVKTTLCSKTECGANHGELILSFDPIMDKLTPVLVGLFASKDYCKPAAPIMFTRLSNYRDWMKAVMREN